MTLAVEKGLNRERVVGIGEMLTSDDPELAIVTFSLGSCVGLTLYDPVAQVGGLCHTMLPLSSMDEQKAAARPGMFTDTGIMALVEEVYKLGAKRKRLEARIAGGGRPLDLRETFGIGQRNYTIARKLLWKNRILISGEDVKGQKPRTMSLRLSDGRVRIKTGGSWKQI